MLTCAVWGRGTPRSPAPLPEAGQRTDRPKVPVQDAREPTPCSPAGPQETPSAPHGAVLRSPEEVAGRQMPGCWLDSKARVTATTWVDAVGQEGRQGASVCKQVSCQEQRAPVVPDSQEEGRDGTTSVLMPAPEAPQLCFLPQRPCVLAPRHQQGVCR